MPELTEAAGLVSGSTCAVTGKIRFLDRRTAETARMLTAKRDTDAERAARLQVFRCPSPRLGWRAREDSGPPLHTFTASPSPASAGC